MMEQKAFKRQRSWIRVHTPRVDICRAPCRQGAWSKIVVRDWRRMEILRAISEVWTWISKLSLDGGRMEEHDRQIGTVR